MLIEYESKKVREICENSKKATKELGSVVARKLHLRLTQIAAFDSLQDVPQTKPFRRHKLIGKLNDKFAVNIDNQYRLIFIAVDGDGEDLCSVKVISIEEVSKHYE